MNVAKSVRLAKARTPERYCEAEGCLWRTETRDGYKPCPKHPRVWDGHDPKCEHPHCNPDI